jgi:long-chain fatty acid transport protein
MEWPEDTGFRTRSIEARLQYLTINPVIGWKPCSAFSIAAGPTINYSEIEIRNGLVSPVPVPNDEFRFNGDNWSAGFNVGILIQPHPKWSFGANYRSAATTDYKGTTTIESPIPAIPSGKADTSLDAAFPQIVSFGVSYRPTPRWNLEVNADYTDWDTLNTLTFKGTSSLLGTDAMIPLNWHGSWFYEAGVSYYFENGYYVSVGYFFSSVTTSSKDFSPSVPDTDLNVGSVGFGYKGKHWRWAVAAQIIAGPSREISHNPPSVVDGSYQLWTPTLSASLGYHF